MNHPRDAFSEYAIFSVFFLSACLLTQSRHDSMTEYYMRNTDEGDVNAAETQSIDARGKNWDYSTVVIEVESKVPTLNGILERTDVVLLSSKHTLGHLRDKLKCEADGAPYASSNKSSCFVFEAVAYLDKRKEGWETYEESVKQLSLRDISTKSIENVPLGELPIRTGRFGWMVHSGGCEHALQITGVRYVLHFPQSFIKKTQVEGYPRDITPLQV